MFSIGKYPSVPEWDERKVGLESGSFEVVVLVTRTETPSRKGHRGRRCTRTGPGVLSPVTPVLSSCRSRTGQISHSGSPVRVQREQEVVSGTRSEGHSVHPSSGTHTQLFYLFTLFVWSPHANTSLVHTPFRDVDKVLYDLPQVFYDTVEKITRTTRKVQ